MNAALAMIEAAAPKDEIEAALAVQMACTHTAAWQFSPSRKVAFTSSGELRLRVSDGSLDEVFSTQVEVFRRLRGGGQQFVRVEHVHVNDGGQAVIGNFRNNRKE